VEREAQDDRFPGIDQSIDLTMDDVDP